MFNFQNQKQSQIKENDLGDYVLQGKIGTGGFGKVYRVKNKKDNKIYAAKISIDSINEHNKRLFQDIFCEVSIISKLNHPSILKFITYSPRNFKRKPKPVLIMEYASNGSLKQLIDHDIINPNHRLLTDTIKLKIIYGIAHAMSYLHSHGILHRDLKPDNILLDDFLYPKVADFGLSKSDIHDEHLIQTATGTIKGTPAYIAPEIWRRGNYSEKSDVYAFSIVVFEIMTLSQAFQNMNIFNLMAAISSCKRPLFNVFVPDSYKCLINRCWSQEASERPTFSEIVCELRNDRSYITESVNVEEFNKYVNYVDGYETSFNADRVVIPAINLVNMEQFNFVNKRLIRIFDDNEKMIHFPYEYSKVLSINSLQDVENAESGNVALQFEIGRNLIESRHDFQFDVRNGLKFLKRSMKGGNKDAASYYVIMLIKGEVVPLDYAKARKIIDKYLSDSENTRLYYQGKVMNKEGRYAESAELFKKSMELNNADSMCEYAELLWKGLLENNDQEEAISLYRKAISLGHLRSMYKLGFHLYESNDKLQQEEGINLIKKAADSGNVKAMHKYGTIVEKEDDNQDSESMKYFKKAADEGYGKSMNKYGVKLLKYLKSLPKQENKSEAVFYLKKASERGFSESMLEYGMLHVDGDIGIPMNAKEGSKYVKSSAMIGNADAKGRYGRLLVEGNGVEIDTELAIKCFKEGIEKGSSIAMHNYGRMLCNGQGVPVNYKEAIKYYKMAINKGNSDSMSNYAYMLQYGLGFPVNYKKAIKYYKMGIDKGNVFSMNNYALMLKNGQGIPVNYKEAIKYLKMASDKGFSTSMNSYAIMLHYGQGIPVDYKEAIKYYKMAIDRGFDHSISNYGLMLQYGQGVPVDIEGAIKYYKMSIDKNNAFSPVFYADILRKGEGVPIDIDKSIKYYKIGIDRKNPFAMYRYASMLENGEGIEVNIEEANKYYKMSIENYENVNFKNEAIVMSGHAMILYEGKGVEKNEEEAIKFFKLAIARNDEESLLRYGQILVNKKETEEMKNEGLELIRKSAERGFSESLYEYGKFLEEGQIVEKNREESIKYYQKAAERGNRNAQEALQRMNVNNNNNDN